MPLAQTHWPLFIFTERDSAILHIDPLLKQYTFFPHAEDAVLAASAVYGAGANYIRLFYK